MLEENIKYIENLKHKGIRLDLKPAYDLMNLLGNPHEKFRSIHITGTNGKGSTATMTASILNKAGYKVGLYTSPYVTVFNERIQINGKFISDEKLDELITKIKKTVEENKLDTTFFEFITALAFSYFAEEKIDIAVVEVGLGGRLDATNVTKSIVSVITNIGLDHKDFLGDTKEEIAKEKAGIIKENQAVITAEKDPKILEYFKDVCNEKNSSLIVLDDVIKPGQTEQSLEYQKFSISGVLNEEFTISLLGEHQIRNASLAIIIALGLRDDDRKITLEDIKSGLREAHINGRMQVLSKKPFVIVDGAHNLEGIKALENYIKPIPNKGTLLIGTTKNRNSKEMLEVIAPLFKQIIVTEGDSQPKKAELLAEEADACNSHVKSVPDSSEALQTALEKTKEGDLILVTGSLYLISAVLKSFQNIQKNIKPTMLAVSE